MSDELTAYHFAALIESADDAIISKTLDGIITSWNRGAERIFGYTAQEAIGKPILLLIPPDRHSEEPAIIERIKSGQRVEHFETIRITKDRRLIDISLTISPIKDNTGKIIGASKIARDITKLKAAEEALHASQERYRSLFNSIDEGFCVIQMVFDDHGKPCDYRFLEVNPSFEAQTGILNAKGKMMLELVPNHDASWFEIYGKVAVTGESIRFENYAQVLDSWFDLYAFRIGAPEERKVAVIFNNITDRKRSEEILRKSDARLRLALDIARTSTFEINLLTDAVETDEIGREIYGFEKDEPLTFTKVQERLHPEDKNWMMREVRAAFDPHGTGEFEVEPRIIRPNGEVRWIRVLGRMFFDDDGKSKRAVSCLGTYIDITKQKESERERLKLVDELIAERSRLQYLFTKAPAFVATLRGAEHVFELTNPAYLQLIGHREVMGKPVREALPDIAGQGYYELLDHVYQTGEPYNGRESVVAFQHKPDSPMEERFVDFVFQPIYEVDKSVSGIFVHGIDITEQVRARREAENSNRLKDEFLATLSHELRTPLNAILGWSQILRSGNLEKSVTEKALNIIEQNAKSQNRLIEDILDVSRIITGKLQLNVRAVDLVKIINAAIETVRPGAVAKNIQLQFHFDSATQIISGDADRLQQVVWNVLSNAVKFTPANGQINLRLAPIGSHIEINVSDTGKGIEPEFLPFVFDRFRQSDGSMTRRHGGLGLGLAIVRQITELHGGTVSVDSAGEGHGATFTISLPISSTYTEPADNSASASSFSENNETSLGKIDLQLLDLHILVVDDEPDSRELLSILLKTEGAVVTTAESASEALAEIERSRFDVIISDIGMPDEDGFTLIQKIRQHPDSAVNHLPAIALTAYARTEDRIRALRSGFQMHIAKPVEHAELINSLNSLQIR